MRDVVFVVPSKAPSVTEEFCGTLLLATILRKNGIDSHIYRFYETENHTDFSVFVKQSADNILSFSPKIVSFYCRCDCFLGNIMIAKEIKEKSPETYIVFGGPQADACAKETLAEISWVDFCCSGEGETTIFPLFSALINASAYKDIKGLTYRSGNMVVSNPRPALIQDLNTIPFIDYSFIPESIIQNALDKNSFFPIDVGRGCPFNCKYCSTSIFWERKYRTKSADRIVEEMIKVYEEFGITRFNFEHDLFTARKSSVMEFCRLIKESNIKFSWICSSRVDTLDEEMIKAMAESGCVWVYMGVESGSERMQKIISKNLKIQDVINVAETLIRHGIYVTASFMYGFPEETREDIEKTLRLVYTLYKAGVKEFQYHLCAIMPGTKYYEEYLHRLTLSDNLSDQVADFGVKEHTEFIKMHTKLFPFYFEYVNELRIEFAHLDDFVSHCIYIFDLLKKFLPHLTENVNITDIYLNAYKLYENSPLPRASFDVAKCYFNAYLDKVSAEKLSAIIDYFKDCEFFNSDKNFTADVRSYPIDINAVINQYTLENIALRDTIVYFARKGNDVQATAVDASIFK